jgi:hypothetical protein
MQQQAAAQVPTPTGTRAAIEGQQDAWWLDKQMKVGKAEHSLECAAVAAHGVPLVGRLWAGSCAALASSSGAMGCAAHSPLCGS